MPKSYLEMSKPVLFVVEGKNDSKRLREIDPNIEVFVTGGMHFSKKEVSYLKACVSKYEIVFLLDPDGAGEKIRRRLMEEIPSAGNIYAPIHLAKEGNKIGIEHIKISDLKEILNYNVKYRVSRGTWTLKKLYEHGLAGTKEAKKRRQELADLEQIPYANAKTFVKILNRYDIKENKVFKG